MQILIRYDFILACSDFLVKLDKNSIAIYCPKQLFSGMYRPPLRVFHNFDQVFTGDCAVLILEQNS
jgi:hypothetical protein